MYDKQEIEKAELERRRVNFTKFGMEICKVMSKKWNDQQATITASFDYLSHIRAEAWPGILPIAVNGWESWPKNFVKAVKEAYQIYQKEANVIHAKEDCEYCNGNGIFTGVKRVEIKTGVFMRYFHTWRCSQCRNAYGSFGLMLTASTPFQVRQLGFDTILNPTPVELDPNYKASPHSIDEALFGAGHQVNRPTARPAIMPLVEN